MPTVILRPSAVTVRGSNPGGPVDPATVVTGPSPQWADGSDATSATIRQTDRCDAPLPSLADVGIDPSSVVGATLHIRVSQSARASFALGYLTGDPDPDASTPFFAGFDLAFPTGGGAIEDFALALTSTAAELAACLGATPFVQFQVSSSGSPPPDLTIYEVWVEVVTAPVIPCNTVVDLDLSTAVFTDLSGGGPYGQYGDGVIYTDNFPGFPDFYFAGLDVDPTKSYDVTVTYDPDSVHDAGGRGFSITGVTPGHEDDPNTITFPIGDLYDASDNTADTLTVTIGPRINGWDDPDFGVTAGFVRLWFETHRDGAVSAITIRKKCNPTNPLLRQYPVPHLRIYPAPQTPAGLRRGPSAIN